MAEGYQATGDVSRKISEKLCYHIIVTVYMERYAGVIESLPIQAQAELGEFLRWLQHKYSLGEPEKSIVKLGGLWADVPYENLEADLLEIRDKSVEHLLEEWDAE